MTIVAEQYEHVVGVDTHARTHTFSVLAAATGAVTGTGTFPTTGTGLSRAVEWIRPPHLDRERPGRGRGDELLRQG